MTYEWQDDPPTHRQWMDAHNEGYWWIKTTIPSSKEEDGMIFPEFHLYDMVLIYFAPDRAAGLLSEKGRLTFTDNDRHIYCDDLPDGYQNIRWQPVAPHSDYEQTSSS